jgi:hypothetical protein
MKPPNSHRYREHNENEEEENDKVSESSGSTINSAKNLVLRQS